MKEAAHKVFRLTCTTEGCGFSIATSGDPAPLQKRLFSGGCPRCGKKEFSANYDTAAFADAEIPTSALSVILAFYKVEPFAKDCIESVLAQDLSPMDVYLVDDGSPDACPEILESFLSDARVVVIHQKNAGLSVARNTALEFLHSEYVTLLDGDDKLLNNPQGYARVLNALKESGADFAYYSYVVHPEGEEPELPASLSNPNYKTMDRSASLDFFFDRVETIYCSAVWNKMARASLFAKARYVPGAYCQDLRMMPNLLRQIGSTIAIEEYLVSYMSMRKGSITRTIRPKLLFDRACAVKDCLDFAKETGCDTYIKIATPIFAKYLAAAYYGAWRGTSADPEERKKERSPEYRKQLRRAFSEEKPLLLSKTHLPDAKKRTALRLFGFSKYAFLIYNRVFHAFDL